MLWEDLTVPQFAQAVGDTGGVCLLPIGVMEAHARHLPLGTDARVCFEIARRAAEREPAIVLPKYFFGINHESMHRAGGIVIRQKLVFDMLENICDECARNGLKKIIIVSGHGGNRFLLNLFVQTQVERDVDYVVYNFSAPRDDDYAEKEKRLLETTENGHAGEWETSIALALFPDQVDTSCYSDAPFHNAKRNAHLQSAGLYSPMDWHAMYPTMQVGHPGKATAEKGQVFVDYKVEKLAAAIRTVRDDSITPELLKQFLAKTRRPTSGWE